MKPIILNESGERCGETGAAGETWSLGSFDPGREYFIDQSSIDASAVKQGDDDRGTMRLPVASVAKMSNRYFFATDYRFVIYPGSKCVFPETVSLDCSITQVGGGWRGFFTFRSTPIFSTKTLRDRNECLAFLVSWAGEQEPERFVFPAEIIDVMKLAEDAANDEEDDANGVDDRFGLGGIGSITGFPGGSA